MKPFDPSEYNLAYGILQSIDSRDWTSAFLIAIEKDPSIITDFEKIEPWFRHAIATGWCLAKKDTK